MIVGETDYLERQLTIKDYNMSLDEAVEYLFQESLKDKYPHTLWMIRSIRTVFGLSLLEARRAIETYTPKPKES